MMKVSDSHVIDNSHFSTNESERQRQYLQKKNTLATKKRGKCMEAEGRSLNVCRALNVQMVESLRLGPGGEP